jgi:hypothetical protein
MAFHNLGHETKNYIGQECIDELENWYSINLNAPQTWGGCIGFDFNKDMANFLFKEIVLLSQRGCFNNSPTNSNHRHDQSVMSVLFHLFGIQLYNYGHIVSNQHAQSKEFGNYYTFIYGKH